MNQSLQNADPSHWNKVRRRWTLVVGVLLTMNGVLVVLAIAGYSNEAPRPSAGPAASGVAVATVESSGKADEPLAPIEAAADGTTKVETANSETANVETASVEAPRIATTLEPTLDDDAAAAPSNTRGTDVGEPMETTPIETNVVTESYDAATPEAGADAPLSIEPAINPASMLIVNPSANGGAVYYVLAGRVFGLEPGEYQELAPQPGYMIIFHRGDDLDDVQRDVASGVFVFDVDAEGWQLNESKGPQAAAVLRGCRKVAEE
jgi:hypothetical protein